MIYRSLAVLGCCLLMGAALPQEHRMDKAAGSFDVKLTPQTAPGAAIDRMSFDKLFHGELDGTSQGEMLAVRTPGGSAGYVAMERVTGTLHGRHGSFVLQHFGTMTRGAPTLTVSVVPDSGTEGLKDITGSMTIENAGGAHRYVLTYHLPE
jgi:hypothetical protein